MATRVDYNLNAKQRMFYRFKTDPDSLPGSQGLIHPAFNPRTKVSSYQGQPNHTYIISPRLVNNFIGSVSYENYVTGIARPGEDPRLISTAYQLHGWRNEQFPAITSIGAPPGIPNGQRIGQFQTNDDVSYDPGRHVWKAGYQLSQ